MYTKNKTKRLISKAVSSNDTTMLESKIFKILDNAFDNKEQEDDTLYLIEDEDGDTWESVIATEEEAKYMSENDHLEHDCIEKDDLSYRKMREEDFNQIS